MSENSVVNRLARVWPIGVALFVLGIGIWVVGFGAVGQKTAMQSYVFAYIFWSFLSIGCLGLVLLHHTIRSSWSLAVLRLLEAGASPANFLLMLILFIPIAVNVAMNSNDVTVYEWARPSALNDHLLHMKAWWLNHTGWIIRGGIYILFWALVSGYMRSSSLRQDKNLDPNEAIKRTNVAAPMMVAFAVSVTLATTDWVMSLAPHWFSTILGLLFMVGSALAALAAANWIVARFSKEEPYNRIVTPALTKDLGNMMFAITLLWTYMTVSQFIITWHGNLPEEVPYYLRRSSESWVAFTVVLVVGQFFLPFLLLLAPRTKQYAKNIMGVATLIFVMRFLDVYWSTMPDMRGQDLLQTLSHWTDYVALIGIGGIWLAVWASQVKKAALLPLHDRRLEEAALVTHHA